MSFTPTKKVSFGAIQWVECLEYAGPLLGFLPACSAKNAIGLYSQSNRNFPSG